jgi:ubiquinone/menaquinone biosynthesis C-methylase UbiE
MKTLAVTLVILTLGLRLGAGEIRLLVFGTAEATAPGDRSGPAAALEGFLDAARIRQVPSPPGEPDGPSFESADAVLLDARSLESLGRWSPRAVDALASAVRGGKALVVAGAAAGALPDSGEFSRLLGRRTRPTGTPGRGLAAIEFRDQSHPVTQCVTHLSWEEGTPPAEPVEGVVALASVTGIRGGDSGASSLLPKPRPAIWARREDRGQVVVLALRPGQGAASAAQASALAFLTARAIQWAAGREVTVRIPRGLPLAAKLLGPGDAGLLPGLPQAEGYYRCRQIAPVMSYHGASWLERAEREKTELPDRVLDSLEIEPGSTLADLGAGTGYFSLRMARRVGPKGRVLAVEIQEEMLALLRERMAKAEVTNVEPILGTEEDPRLPEGAVDLALLVDVYHELSRPAEIMARVMKGLAPAREGRRPGRLVLVEYRGEDPAVPIKPLHRMTEDQVRAELEPLAFRWLETKEFLPHQHILIFQR